MPASSDHRLAQLDERARKLALEKSHLELVIRLMNRISSDPGLDRVVDNLMRAIVEIIGGTNVALYYWIDERIVYADVIGVRK